MSKVALDGEWQNSADGVEWGVVALAEGERVIRADGSTCDSWAIPAHAFRHGEYVRVADIRVRPLNEQGNGETNG